MEKESIEFDLKKEKIKLFLNLLHNKSIVAEILRQSFIIFNVYELEEVREILTEPDDPVEFPLVRHLLTGNTQDLGLPEGEFIGIRMFLPDDFDAENFGIGYLFLVVLTEENLTDEETQSAVINFSEDQYYRKNPFNEDIIESFAPIFNIFVVVDGNQNESTSLIQCFYNYNKSDESKETDIIRSIAVKFSDLN